MRDVVAVTAAAAAASTVRGPRRSYDVTGTGRCSHGAARQPDRPRPRRQRLGPRGAVQRSPQHGHQPPAVQLLQEPQAAGQFLQTAGSQVDRRPRPVSVLAGAATSPDDRHRSRGVLDARPVATTAQFQSIQLRRFVDVCRRVQRWPVDAVQKLGNGVEKLSALFLKVCDSL